MLKAGSCAGSISRHYDTVSRRPSNDWTVVQISGGFAAKPSVNYLALRLSSQKKFRGQEMGSGGGHLSWIQHE